MSDTQHTLPRVFLQTGHDRRIADGHPWAYSNEIRMDADAKALPAGTLATLHRIDGKPLGVGSFNPHTLIAFRIFDHDAAGAIDEAFFVQRFRRAARLRERVFAEPYWRLAHAEADGLPGLVCDRFGDVLVMQMNTAGMQALSPLILSAADAVLAPRVIVLRNDTPARETEGIERSVSVVRGTIEGPVALRESGLVFFADVLDGQKTGWFYDQRASRAFVAPLARNASLLDAYCYTGGFAVAAAAAGAVDVVGIDSSEPALALAGRAAQANGADGRCEFRRAEIFGEMERLGRAGERYRVVVADPPAFVKSKKDLGSGLRGYRKLARLAAALVEPEGFLFIASCSHNVESSALLAEVVHGVTAAGRSARFSRWGKAATAPAV
jgi:23S rRNA (cytosine1962-C5)-methyltransferase